MPQVLLRPPTAEDLPALAQLIDVTSRGRFFAFGELDQWKLVGMSMYWRFSLPLSTIAFLDGEPAGCSITCTESDDPAAGGDEAYSLYTGVRPDVRERTIGRELWYSAAERMKEAGFRVCYADTTHTSPTETLERAGWRKLPWCRTDWTTPTEWPAPPAHLRVQILPIEKIDTWRPDRPLRHWTQRSAFLARNYRQLTAIGAYEQDRLAAWAVLSNYAPRTLLVDFGAVTASAALALFTWLRAQRYSEPFTVTMTAPGSSEDQILRELRATVFAESHEIQYPMDAQPVRLAPR